jgi:hypothetical protein
MATGTRENGGMKTGPNYLRFHHNNQKAIFGDVVVRQGGGVSQDLRIKNL